MRCATTNSLLLCGIAVAAIGCQSTPHSGDLADFKEVWPHQTPPTVAHPKSVMVVEGPSPLVFQVQEPSVAHIVDLTTGQEIASASVGRGAMVYVSEDSGAFADKRRLVSGPFVEGHRYGISIDVEQNENWRARTEVLQPPPPPATQPRGQ